jgi:hypothetical protein
LFRCGHLAGDDAVRGNFIRIGTALPDAQQGRGDAAANEQQFMLDNQLAMSNPSR